jgi:hypothetical protein
VNKQFSRMILAAALAGGLAACATPASTPAGDTSGSSSSSPTPTATGTPSPSASASASASPSASAPAPGTPAALAWAALMDPVGEYAAVARYSAVIDAFGPVQPYVNIKTAEEQHISALTRQLERFGAKVPANPYLGKTSAPADLKAAAQAGIVGEKANVAMYDKLLPRVTDAGLTRVFTDLRRASLETHLPLFEAAAKNDGTLTEAQMIELGLGLGFGG